MLELIREAPLGVVIRFLSRNRLLQYPEEQPDFKLPVQYLAHLGENIDKPHLPDETSPVSPSQREKTIDKTEEGSRPQSAYDLEEELETLGMVRSLGPIRSAMYSTERMHAEKELEMERVKSIPIIPQKTSNGIVLVDWYEILLQGLISDLRLVPFCYLRQC
jgi:DHA1 family multidrug resistance protein-like MFS transporter